MTLTIYLQGHQYLVTGSGIEATAHLDPDEKWSNVAHYWRSQVRGKAAPWILAIIATHDAYLTGDPNPTIVCAGMDHATHRLIADGDWAGTDLAAHIDYLRALPGTLVSRNLTRAEVHAIQRRGSTAHQLGVVAETLVLSGVTRAVAL